MNTFHTPTSPTLYRVLEIKMGHLCHLCGARFLLLSTMISHLETHRLGYMCLRCGFISPTIIHQSLHDRVCATNSAPVYLVFKAYQCPVCKYCSSHTSDMLHHVLRRHEVFPIRHFCLKKIKKFHFSSVPCWSWWLFNIDWSLDFRGQFLLSQCRLTAAKYGLRVVLTWHHACVMW